MMRASESSAMTRAWPALPGWVVTCAVALLAGGCIAAQEPQPRDATWFEGARLIDGTGGAPVERSAFVVEDGILAWVGAQGEREAPEGAARVDLTGKTVIPALIDAHQHLGLTSVTEGTYSTDNYTVANLVDHLERTAYHGVAATMSLGLEADETLAFELRNARFPNAARFLTSGRGIAATPMAGPQQEYRLGIPRGAQTAAEGRAAVDELHGHGVDIIKIWVDDRGGTVLKLAAGGLPGDHRRGARPRHAGNGASRLHQRAGRRQGTAAGGRRWLRAHGARPRRRRRVPGAGP